MWWKDKTWGWEWGEGCDMAIGWRGGGGIKEMWWNLEDPSRTPF